MREHVDEVFFIKFVVQLPVAMTAIAFFCYYTKSFILTKYLLLLLSGSLAFALFKKGVKALALVVAAFLLFFVLLLFSPGGLSFYILTVLPELTAFIMAGYFIAMSICKIVRSSKKLRYSVISCALLLGLTATIDSNLLDLGTNALVACEYAFIHYGNQRLRFDKIEFCGPLDGYIVTYNTPEGDFVTVLISSYQVHKTSVV